MLISEGVLYTVSGFLSAVILSAFSKSFDFFGNLHSQSHDRQNRRIAHGFRNQCGICNIEIFRQTLAVKAVLLCFCQREHSAGMPCIQRTLDDDCLYCNRGVDLFGTAEEGRPCKVCFPFFRIRDNTEANGFCGGVYAGYLAHNAFITDEEPF